MNSNSVEILFELATKWGSNLHLKECKIFCFALDWWFHSADPVHAARPPDHIPPQLDPGERCGAIQLQRWSREGPKVSAHVSPQQSEVKKSALNTRFPFSKRSISRAQWESPLRFFYQCDWMCADVIFGFGESHGDRRYSHDLVKCVAISH